MTSQDRIAFPHHELRAKLGIARVAAAGNSVQIDPGGAIFPTIGAALASITDNSLQKQYLQVYLAYATVLSTMAGSDSVAVAMIVNGQATAELTESKVMATGGLQSFGITTSQGAAVSLFNGAVQGASFALYMSDGTGSIVATNCQIDGPVSPGVQIVNN